MPNDKITKAKYKTVNLATMLDQKELDELGTKVVEDFRSDEDTRTNWNNKRKKWNKLFMQDTDPKSFPWANSSNVVLPIMTAATIQYQARAYDVLMPAKNKIKVAKTGLEDEMQARRVEKYMNWQVDVEMEDFEEGWDVSLMQLPINGSIFRKTYFDAFKRHIVSTYCPVEDVVVNYETDPTNTPHRITHVLGDTTINDLLIGQEREIYSNIDKLMVKKEQEKIIEGNTMPTTLINNEVREAEDKIEGTQPPLDTDSEKRIVLEQHALFDLDDDGIKEPYIVWVDYETETVIRITKRTMEDGRVVDHFTHYYFFPNPEGYYGLGFGHMLEGINHSANSVLNQIIDAGTLANLSGKTGFINRRTGLKKGDIQLALGDYVGVDVQSDDIRKAIYSFDFPGPSGVLFSVLGLLQDYAERVSTVSETLTGEMPRSDTSATSTQNAVEQGIKVFSVIHKRVHRTFKKELKKMFNLNSVYANQKVYEAVLGDFTMNLHKQAQIPVSVQFDFAFSMNVQPVSDPNITSKGERVQIAQLILETGMSNPDQSNNPQARNAMYRRYYEALGIEDVEEIMPPPPEPPDLPQHEENAMFLREENVDALQHQPHEVHLQEMDVFEQSAFFAELSPQGKSFFDKHRQQHVSFVYLMEVQLAQQADQGVVQDGGDGGGVSQIAGGVA